MKTRNIVFAFLLFSALLLVSSFNVAFAKDNRYAPPCGNAGDINHDRQVNVVDAMLIGQYAKGMITTFPVCK